MDNDILRVDCIHAAYNQDLENVLAAIWSPYFKRHLDKGEKVQRIATMVTPRIKERPYRKVDENLGCLRCGTLERGNLIMTFKLIRELLMRMM